MRSEARIIDANANRAAEGLRVLEDIARFALDDGELALSVKEIRHDLTATVGLLPIPTGLRLAARDTPGDVGTGVSTEQEMSRVGLHGVAAAAAGRTTEALRALEEMAKVLLDADGAGAIERIRYRVYEVERLVRSGLVPRSRQWRLCVLLTEALCAGRPWEAVAEAAIAGGATCLQLREKALPDRELLVRARRLVEIAAADARVSVVINDRPDVALLANADGVHVGQGDLTPADVRAVAGAGMEVGVSTSCIAEALAAMTAGASSVGLGPMFETTTKRKDRVAGVGYLRAFLADERVSHLPHLCIGGIGCSNAALLADAGARGFAVSSAVCGADDPEAVCGSLVAALTSSDA